MYPEQLLPIINLLYDANIPLILWGPGGAGKSSLVHYLAEQRKLKYFDLRLATQEVGEVVGMPYINDASIDDIAEAIMRWSKPEWWSDDDEWILLLDEVNRAERRLIQAIFQLITDRRIHTHILPENVRLIACCNPPGDGNIVNKLDEPFLTRFAHLSFEPSVDALKEFCPKRFSPDILNFLSESPEQLMDLVSDFDIESVRKRTPRTWEYASKVYSTFLEDKVDPIILTNSHEFNILRDSLSSCIGMASAHDYLLWVTNAWSKITDLLDGSITINDVKNDSDLTRLVTFITSEQTENILGNNSKAHQYLDQFLTDITNRRADLAVSLANSVSAHRFPNLHKVIYNNAELINTAVDAYVG